MRILVLTPTFLPVVGGAELVLYEVYRRLAGRHEVRLITPVLSDELLARYASDEYPESKIPFEVRRYQDRVTMMKVPGHRLSGGLIPPFSFSAVTATRAAIDDFRPAVMNLHYLMPTGLAGWVAEHRCGVPTVMTLNGRDVPGPGVPPLWRGWQRWLIGAVTDVTYVSGYCRDAIYRAGKGPGTVIYNGVDMPPPAGDRGRGRQMIGVDDSEFVIFSLGRLAREKRVDVLLRGMLHFLSRGGTGTLVVGGTGSESDALRTLARELAIEEHVHFAGFIPTEDLPSYFEACDAFAFHSTYETFGIVIAQAMSYGKPVVTADNTALPEVLGDAGLLAAMGDWRGFGDALLALARDPAQRRRLGEAGRARAAELFNWDDVATHYEKVLERAAAGVSQ